MIDPIFQGDDLSPFAEAVNTAARFDENYADRGLIVEDILEQQGIDADEFSYVIERISRNIVDKLEAEDVEITNLVGIILHRGVNLGMAYAELRRPPTIPDAPPA